MATPDFLSSEMLESKRCATSCNRFERKTDFSNRFGSRLIEMSEPAGLSAHEVAPFRRFPTGKVTN